MTLAALVALVVLVGRRPRRRRRSEGVDAPLVGRLVLVGLGAGLSVEGAIELAADEADPVSAVAVRRVAHRARHAGVGAAADGADPELVPLLRVLARAAAVGAPVAAEVAAHLREVDRDRRSRALASTRSLAVRLALPLTLLVLPGVLLLTVAPTLVATLADLGGPAGLP